MFPLSLKRKMLFRNYPLGEERLFIEALAGHLRTARANNLQVDANRLSFTAGHFRRVSGLNPLVCVSRGSLVARAEESRLRVQYELRFGEHLVTSLLLSGFFGVASYLYLALPPRLCYCAAAFALALFGGLNIPIADFEFRYLLYKAWRDASATRNQ